MMNNNLERITTWKRIDNTRRVRDYAYDSIFGRIYGLKGELWPRISSQIFRSETGMEDSLMFVIRRKDSTQGDWYDYPLPIELLPDFIIMTKEYYTNHFL